MVTAEHAAANDDVREALQLVLHGLEQRAEQGLTAVLEAGLRALFSRSMRGTAEREVERILREGVVHALEAAPNGAITSEVESQIEHVVQAALPEVLDDVFGGPIGAEIERHGQRAIEAIVRKDVGAAQGDTREALSEALEGTLQIVQRHKQDVLMAIVRVLTTASEQLATEKRKDSLQAAGDSARAVAEHSNPVKDTVDSEGGGNQHAPPPRKGKQRPGETKARQPSTGDELRDQLRQASRTLRHQITEETAGLQDRLGEELKSKTKTGQQSGRPPAAGRSSLGRPPSRSAPRGRPSPVRRSPR